MKNKKDIPRKNGKVIAAAEIEADEDKRMDVAMKYLGLRSRSDFIRMAITEKLRTIETQYSA